MELENNMPEGWIDTDIGESSIVTTGFPFKSKEYSEYGKLKVVRGENVSLKKLRWNNCKYWIHSTKNLEQYFLQAGDIVVGMDGSRIGKNKASVSFSDLPLILAQRVARIRAIDGVSQQFLKYTILNKKFERYIIKIQTGTSIPHISLGQIKDFNFILPPLPEQKAIAKVLTAFDDKIELLQAQNKTLESMAQTIFKEWFGKYQIGDELPEGWRVERIKDSMEIRNGYAFKSLDYKLQGVPIVRTTNFNNGSINLNSPVYLSNEKSAEYTKFLLHKFDFLLVMVGASIGKNVITPEHILPALQNQNMWNFKSKKNENIFYNIHTLKKIIKQQMNSASGSARDFFRKDYFYELEIIKPPKELLMKFNEIVETYYTKIDINITQIQSLTKTRDTLLPKLMSGQVRVNNIKQTANA